MALVFFVVGTWTLCASDAPSDMRRLSIVLAHRTLNVFCGLLFVTLGSVFTWCSDFGLFCDAPIMDGECADISAKLESCSNRQRMQDGTTEL